MRSQHRVKLFDLLNSLKLAILCHELVERVEVVRLDVIKEGKELFCIILNWSSSQEQYFPTRVGFQELQSLGLLVLQTMCLVDHHV